MNDAPSRPAEHLLGQSLDGGWTVVELFPRPSGSTGANFSVGYIVQNRAGDRAFLKALDFSSALAEDDFPRAVQDLLVAYNHERDLVHKCRAKNLSRIIQPITDGMVTVDPTSEIGRVPYIIFELAQADIRAYLDALTTFDLAWVLRSLHNTAAGLQQLHMVGIAHQDIKPSNVLVIADTTSKLADLGRSSLQGMNSPADNMPAAGALRYAPPERLYDYQDSNWVRRRFGCDAYHLGALTSFHFTRTSVTAEMQARLDPRHRWNPNTDAQPDYHELLPYLEQAFGEELVQVQSLFPSVVRTELTQVVKELCHPDPHRRGHPHNRGASNPYDLQQYISKFNLLAVKARYGLLRTQ